MESGAWRLEMELRDPQANTGRADDWESPDGSVQLGGPTGGAEGLKVDSGDKAKKLGGFGSGGGKGRLDETIRDGGDLEQGRANSDGGDLELDNKGFVMDNQDLVQA